MYCAAEKEFERMLANSQTAVNIDNIGLVSANVMPEGCDHSVPAYTQNKKSVPQ